MTELYEKLQALDREKAHDHGSHVGRPRVKEIPVIQVRNAQRKRRVDLKGLQQFARDAFEQCLSLPKAKSTAAHALSELGVVLVSDRRIADLHKRFMNIAGATAAEGEKRLRDHQLLFAA